tara:strand:+ start:342 stop:1325 length:984 start_codon:yes stop_codon:yes gene_type:complete
MFKWSSSDKAQRLHENFRNFVQEAPDPSREEDSYKPKKDDLPFIKKFLAIKDLPLPQYVAGLKKISRNPGFRVAALAGQKDSGGAGDEAVTIPKGGTGVTTANQLRPTQADIGFFNSLADQVINKYNSTQKVLNDEPVMLGGGGGSPILTYNGKWILDGHHRWSQIMMTNPNAKVAIADLSGGGLDNAEEALKATQLAIAAYTGDLKTKPLGGPDLMKTSPEKVKQFVMKNITDDVLKLLAAKGVGDGTNREVAADYFVKNLKIIQPLKGPFGREQSMPQADYTGGKGTQAKINQALSKGIVNFDEPSLDDIKEVVARTKGKKVKIK